MDEHVTWVIMHAVDQPTPNKCDIVRYSTFVASLQMVMATHFSTDTAPRSTVSCLSRLPRSLRHINLNVAFNTYSEILLLVEVDEAIQYYIPKAITTRLRPQPTIDHCLHYQNHQALNYLTTTLKKQPFKLSLSLLGVRFYPLLYI